MLISRVFSVLLVSLPLSLLVSCSKETPQAQDTKVAPSLSTEDKKATMCTDLARFKTSVATLKSKTSNSTVGDLRKAQEQVKTTLVELKASALAVQDSQVADLETATKNLETAIAAIPDTATIAQAGAAIAPSVVAVEAAEAKTKADLKCS
jgi:predicted RecB family endonuclease